MKAIAVIIILIVIAGMIVAAFMIGFGQTANPTRRDLKISASPNFIIPPPRDPSFRSRPARDTESPADDPSITSPEISHARVASGEDSDSKPNNGMPDPPDGAADNVLPSSRSKVPVIPVRKRKPEAESLQAFIESVHLPDIESTPKSDRRDRVKEVLAPIIVETLEGKRNDLDVFDGALILCSKWTGTSESDRDDVRGPLARALARVGTPKNLEQSVEFADWAFRTGRYWKYYKFVLNMDPRYPAQRLDWILEDDEVLHSDGNRAPAALAILYAARGTPELRSQFTNVFLDAVFGRLGRGCATELQVAILSMLIRAGKPDGFDLLLELKDRYSYHHLHGLLDALSRILNIPEKEIHSLPGKKRVNRLLNELETQRANLVFLNGEWVIHSGKPKKRPTRSLKDDF